MDGDLDDIVDLSTYDTQDACLWLMEKLEAEKFRDNPYHDPFCNYLSTWHRAVPLNAIVLAQSPYPNPIYPPVAAAMSYDKELCRKIMKLEMPPTVAILANDLRIHAKLAPEVTDDVIGNGWSLVDSGILLINQVVFRPYGTAEAYKECVDQCNVLLRLLRETEKYGERTVDIIAYGDAGKRMASDICKYFKSNKIKLSKYVSGHPASLAYRMSDFTSPDCHLNAQGTSKRLAKHISNYVASSHVMAKKSAKEELAERRRNDAITSVTAQFDLLETDSAKLFSEISKMLDLLDSNDVEAFRVQMMNVGAAGTTFQHRLRSTSAALSQVNSNFTAGASVSKPGPSLPMVNPTSTSLAQHVGANYVPPPAPPMKTVSLKPSRINPTMNGSLASSRRDSVTSATPSVATESKTTQISDNLSSISATPGRKVTLRKSTPVTRTPEVNVSPTAKADDDAKTTTSSVSTSFRNLQLSHPNLQSTTPGSTGKTKRPEALDETRSLSKEVIAQLSGVEAVLQTKANRSRLTDNEISDMLDHLESDIANGIAYNNFTLELALAAKKDMERNPKFNFAILAVSHDESSAMYKALAEIFEFK